MMIVFPLDRLSGQLATEAYETAAHPKKLQLVAGATSTLYTGPGFQVTSTARATGSSSTSPGRFEQSAVAAAGYIIYWVRLFLR